MARSSLAEALLKLEPAERRAELKQMSHRQRRSLKRHWRLWAHEGQAPPQGGWHTWLVMAGRGYGKTRAGAEWVREVAENDPTARIALIGASLGEARRVMVEGPSGLLAIAPPRQRPSYEPSKRQLTWPKGAVATLYSAGEPESLRGPQHSHACRAGPEGVFRQRGACADRCAAPPGDRRRSRRPSGHPGRGRNLADRRCANRGMGGSCRRDSVVPSRRMGLRRPSRRNARARPFHRARHLLARRLAPPGRAAGAERRHHGRYRSADCDRRFDRRAGRGRVSGGRLTRSHWLRCSLSGQPNEKAPP